MPIVADDLIQKSSKNKRNSIQSQPEVLNVSPTLISQKDFKLVESSRRNSTASTTNENDECGDFVFDQVYTFSSADAMSDTTPSDESLIQTNADTVELNSIPQANIAKCTSYVIICIY